MAKFRKVSTGTKTVNKAGGVAFKEDPKLELVSLLLTSFVSDKFYEKANDQLDRLTKLVDTVDPKFSAKAAIYARNEFGMRSITHALIGELVHKVKGASWTKNAIQKTVKRPDDMLEMLAYYGNKYGKPFPNSLKKGLSLALGKFDEYSLAKYRGERSDVSLVDLVNLVHFRPPKEKQELFRKLMRGELASKDTWESKLSVAGQQAEGNEEKAEELKGEAWAQLIKEKKIGYFALLRNLRNLEKYPDLMPAALELLVDENLIKKSLVLPFRFQTAAEQISDRKTLVAIHKALDIAVANVPKFKGKTLIVLDVSGSMTSMGKSTSPAKIGSLFSAVLYKVNDADFIEFSDSARYRVFNPSDSAMTIANSISNASGGTNFPSIFQTANKRYDRIIILSDMQGWMGGGAPTRAFEEYKKRTGANPHIFSFDLQGYGTLQFPQPQVYAIAGFSEKILDVMGMLEEDRNALIRKIESVEL